MQAVSAASSVLALYQTRFSVAHLKLLWTHWKSRDTFFTQRVNTLHLDAGAPIPSRMQDLSSHPLSLQVMFSLMPQVPPCQASSARRGGSCDLALVMDFPELVTQSCRALLRCSHLLPNCWSWNQTSALNTTWCSQKLFLKAIFIPLIAQIALLLKTADYSRSLKLWCVL